MLHSLRMDRTEIQNAFADFCGGKKFNLYLEKLHSYANQKKILFWQEELWDAFAEQSTLELPKADDYDGLAAVFSEAQFRKWVPTAEEFLEHPF